MALLVPQQSTILGTLVTYVAATTGAGDTFVPDSRGTLRVRNGSGVSITVTLAVPGNDRYGTARPDIATAIAAGLERQFGPFDADLADLATGFVTVTYSAVTTVTVAYTTV